MNILETFFILFESNASKAEEDAKKAEGAHDKLEDKIKLTDKASQKLGDSLHQNVKELAAMAFGLAAVALSVSGVAASLEFAAKLDDVSESIGISTEDLSAWGDAVKREGGTVDGFTSSLTSLAVQMNQVDVTGKSRLLPFFKDIGVEMLDAQGKARPVLDVLTDLSKKFDTMSKQESLAFGRKLGLDDGLIRLLQKGNAGLEEAIAHERALGVVTAEQAAAADELGKNIDDLSHVFRTFSLMIGGIVAPPLTFIIQQFVKLAEVLTGLPEWIERNQQYIESFGVTLAVIGGVIAASYIPMVFRMIAANVLLARSFLGLAINVGIAMLPILGWVLLIVAGFAALYLIIDDVWAYFQGGDSYIVPFLKGIWEWVGKVWDKFKEWKDLIVQIVELIAKIALGPIAEAVMGGIKIGQKIIGQMDSAPLAAQTSSSIMMQNQNRSQDNSVSIGTMTVQTQATNGTDLAADFRQHLADQTKQASDNFTDGVKK